jgi:hypothetical protein
MKLGIISDNIIEDNSLKNFIIHYGNPTNTYKNIYEFKKENISIIAYLNKKKLIYKAQFSFYKSKINLSSLKTKLLDFQLIKQTSHSSGSSITYKEKNETIKFNNNTKRNIRSYEVRWEL